MNKKKIEIICEFLIEQMNHWFLFPIILTVMGVVRAFVGMGEPGLGMWALCSLLPLVFFLFRCKLKNLILFLLAHMGVAALVFLLAGQSIMARLICTACVIGYMLYSCVLRLKRETVYSDGLPLTFGVGTSAVASLIQRTQGTTGWENYYHFTLIGGIALYFIVYFIEHYLDFLEMNKSSAGFLPAKEMFHSGMGLVLGYTLLGAVILIFSTQFEWLAGILRPIKDFLLRLIRFLLSRSSGEAEESHVPMEEAAPMGGMGDMGLPEAGEPSLFWRVLEVVVIIAFAAGILLGLALLLRKLFQLIQKYMVFRYREQEIQTGEAFDFREKCEIEKNSDKKRAGLFDALSPRERIRKVYKKKLGAVTARAKDQGDPQLSTAREWEKKLTLSGMAEVYERARYSNQEITGADVKKMKEAWK